MGMNSGMSLWRTAVALGTIWLAATSSVAQEPAGTGDRSLTAPSEDRVRRVLVFYQGPDGHAAGSHEYDAGLRVIEALAAQQPQLEIIRHDIAEYWPQSPDAAQGYDALVLFIAMGASWATEDARRYETLLRFAEAGGGLMALHWGTGTKPVEPIVPYVRLLGACHGGPDRHYRVLETVLSPAEGDHPLLAGLQPVRVLDEYYYRLKTAPEFLPPGAFEGATTEVVPIMFAEIDDQPEMVAWAWSRPDGGRSFGFTGLHNHAGWYEMTYRRLVANALLWVTGLPVPAEGAQAEVARSVIDLQSSTNSLLK